MKNIFLTLALALFCFTSCKNSTDANEDSDVSMDSTAVHHETATDMDTVNSKSDSITVTTDSTTSTDAKSNVKLPNKVSATTKVIPGEKGKYSLAETKWGLIELNGKPVDATTRRDYFINFDSKSGTFRSFVGCNRISGNYFMKSSDKLGFSNIISTRMACENMDVERNFYNNLQKVDNYMIEEGGKVLHLHIGKKAVAKFEAIR
jgi:heat shock protein HslJ